MIPADLPTEPRIDDYNRCMGRWWEKRIYIIAGETWPVTDVVDEPGRYMTGGIKFDSLQRVVEVYGDMTRERAEAVMATMGTLMAIEEQRDNELADRKAADSAAYEVYASQFKDRRYRRGREAVRAADGKPEE
jgi:hypothetical protein